MINFFRKTRKKLADNNQFLKYSRYAIGEIVLVVIGILIALSINNWNEGRKRRNVEIELLKTIKSDLESTLFDIKKDYKNHLKSQSSGNIFKSFLLGENMIKGSIVPHFESLCQDRHFFPKSAGYESLKSSDMNIISNDSLRLNITELYELAFHRIKEWDESNPRWDIGILLQPYYKKHFILTDEAIETIENSAETIMYKFKLKSIENMRNDNDFQIDLQESFQLRRRKIWINKSGIDRIESVLTEIHKEFKRLNVKD